MTEPLDVVPEDLQSGPPELLSAMPSWYPGAWGPPAETLTIASVLVALAGTAFLFRNTVDRALFRFPFDAYLLAVPATLLALTITVKGSSRPGSWWPRIWALALTAFCASTTVWGVVDRFHSLRASPQVHAFSYIALLSSLALAPRLLRIPPYSPWVQHIAGVSLVWVAALCLFGAIVAETKVIREEMARIEASIQELNRLTDEVRKVSGYSWSKRSDPRGMARQMEALKKLSLTAALPDDYVWMGAGVLKKKDDLQQAVSSLVDAVEEAFQSAQAPKLSLARLRADDRYDERWVKERRFGRDSVLVADYYREVSRLQRELDARVPASPAKDQYEARKQDYNNRVQTLAATLGEQWIAALVSGDMDLVAKEKLLGSPFEALPYLLGDLGRWGTLSWADAKSLLGHTGCASEPVTYPVTETERVSDSSESSGFREIEVTYYYRRVECYAYRPLPGRDGADMASELHLMYKLGQKKGYGAPLSVSLYFDPPSDTAIAQFQTDLMQTLEDMARERSGRAPEKLDGGFRVRSPRGFIAQASRIARPDNAPCIRVKVEME